MSARMGLLILRFVVIVVAMAVLGGLAQSLSYDLVLPWSLIPLGIGTYLFLRPGRLGRAIGIPFFVSFFLNLLLWFSIFAVARGISIPPVYDIMFPLVVVVGFVAFLLTAKKELKGSSS